MTCRGFSALLVAFTMVASACYYNPTSVAGTPALSDCLGVPATMGVGWVPADGSGVTTHQGTAGDDVVVIANGPVRFDGLGGDDLICVNDTGTADNPQAGTQPFRVNGNGGNDTIVNRRGAANVIFTGGSGNDRCLTTPGPGSATTNCETVTGVDPHPATAGVIESFGEITPAAHLGISAARWAATRPEAWDVLEGYNQQFGQPGDCGIAEHSSWWTVGPDGRIYPSWHPPVSDTGCPFGHEHGTDDPSLSPIYEESGGVTFGYANEVYATEVPAQAERHEDHVGHKVVVRTGWTPAFGNGGNTGEPLTAVTGVTCNWLSKVHQGTWSPDAFANNLHEYQLNLRCNGRGGSGNGTSRAIGATTVHIKELMHWGKPNEFFRDCAPLTPVASTGGPTHPSANLRVPYISGGIREIACADFWAFNAGNHRDLWKPDGALLIPQADGSLNGDLAFSAYYAVWNPARAVSKTQVVPVRSIDLCFGAIGAPNANGSWINQGDLCSALSLAIRGAAPATRWQHVDSPFNGTLRGVNPKSITVRNNQPLNNGPAQNTTVFCTDSLGEGSFVAGGGACDPKTSIRQEIGGSNFWNVGDNFPQITASTEAGLTGAGPGLEWFVQHDDTGVHAPN